MKGNIFIKRPVMAISISVLILAIGLISLFTLPVEQYPDIAPPTVYVAASYTGADAEAVMNSVIMPLEESINGVEDMMYITSSASNAGLAIIQVYFKQGTDPDMAAVNVQNRVAKAQGLLPAEVTKVGVSTMKRQTSFLQIGAMVCTDGRYDQTFLANYLDINVIPQTATVRMQDKTIVYKVVDGKTVSTLITVAGINDGREYVVLDGLKAGDEIVSEGAGLVREGTQVK